MLGESKGEEKDETRDDMLVRCGGSFLSFHQVRLNNLIASIIMNYAQVPPKAKKFWVVSVLYSSA